MQYVTWRDQWFFRPKRCKSAWNGRAGSMCSAEMCRKCVRPCCRTPDHDPEKWFRFSEEDHGPGKIISNARHADRGMAGTDEAELAGGALRQVEHATPDERAAIVDAHDDAAAIVLVGDPQFGAER